MLCACAAYLQKTCQEDGKILNKLLLVVCASLISLGYVSGDRQYSHKLVHENDIQLNKLRVGLWPNRQAANLQSQGQPEQDQRH